MSEFNKALKTLEYGKVLEMLAECAVTEGAKTRALASLPEDDEVRIRKKLAETTDAKNLSAVKGAPSFGYVTDISESVERAVKGAMLSTRELLDIAALLETVNTLVEYSSGKNVALGSLAEIIERLQPDSLFAREIRRIIISEDLISDDASPKLSELRRSIRLTNSRIRDTLQRYITSDQYSKHLQENIITIRGGRYVIPVKAEHKNDVKGLVHDSSSSGATLFIEPMAVVEANNELRELEIAERKEIERILYELSDKAARESGALNADYFNVTELAYIFARSELSWKMDAVEPIMTVRGSIDLRGARHPLLKKDKVVPIDMRLGGAFDTLIITGPNTGGKTVSLKTLGLLTLMAQSGLHIPAKEDSRLRIMSKVLADIGDEQSIEQSLSTFSAHMTNIVRILSDADQSSLVLFDELGAGTDPIEGAALAVAIIEKTRDLGALCAATTHYAEVKMYALDTAGVCNAACEFNVDTLSPTYRLIIGTPGRSNAFAISSRLGLDGKVIERASELISPDSKRFEDVIDKLDADRTQTEKKLNEAEEYRQKYERLYREALEKHEKELKAAKAEKDRAVEQARRIIESARATSDYVLAELEKAKKAKDSENYAKELEEARNSIRSAFKRNSDAIDPVEERDVGDYIPSRPIKKGDEVLIVNINKTGTVISDPDKDGAVTVRTGSIRMKTSLKNLMLAEDVESRKRAKTGSKQTSSGSASSLKFFSPEIDLRGMNGEDARLAVDRYLDEAVLSGLHTVRIIHGKGTGALKKYLWDFFRTDKRIKSYRLGNYGEGDGGVTVIELK